MQNLISLTTYLIYQIRVKYLIIYTTSYDFADILGKNNLAYQIF